METLLPFQKILECLDDPDVLGSPPEYLNGIASLEDAGPQDLSFLSGKKYSKYLETTQAGAILIARGETIKLKASGVYIKVDNTSLAIAKICNWIESQTKPVYSPGIAPSAIIAESAIIDPSATIGPYVVIEEGAVIESSVVIMAHSFVGRNAKIGASSLLHPRVSVLHQCVVGKRCILYSGAILGGDGFGYHSSAAGHRKLAQIGNVVLGDDVEVGCNAVIDRARFAATKIGSGTKIDNLVQIGHNVTIGEHSIICSLVGISGSSHLGKFVTLAGQVGVAGHLTLGDGVIGLGQAGITRDFPDKTIVAGTPARPHNQQRKAEAITLKLPQILERIKKLESESTG